MSRHKKYTVEFKQEAVKLVTDGGYSQAKASRRLGVGSKNMSRWVREAKAGIPRVKKSLTAEQAELLSSLPPRGGDRGEHEPQG